MKVAGVGVVGPDLLGGEERMSLVSWRERCNYEALERA